MSKAREFYQALNPQQKEFVDQKTISTSVSVKNWLLFLNKATAYDQFIDKSLNRSLIWIIVLTMLMIGSAIAAGMNENANILFITLAIGIVLIFMVRDRQKLLKRDINNYLSEFFIPFLEVMRIKAGEEAKLSAALDFRNPEKALKPTNYMEAQPRKRSVKLYEPKFIVAKIALLDQSYLETVIADDIKVLSYRNPRGKYKTKRKTVHHYYVKLTVSKTVYRLKSSLLPPETELSENENEYIFKHKGKVKDYGVTILKPETYFRGLQIIYDQLTPLDSPTSGTQQPPVSATTPAEGVLPLQNNAIPAMIWADSYFGRYDYDSTRHRGDVPLLVDEESNSNIFDS